MSTALQNATDRVTESVNIAAAYDLHGSLNTHWHSTLLLKDSMGISEFLSNSNYILFVCVCSKLYTAPVNRWLLNST